MSGMTLAQRMEEGRLPVAEALALAMGLAHELRRLHDRGEYHGALTPAEVELTEGGPVILPAMAPTSRLFTAYTAPEVAQGRQPDARSDIFAFGAILFEMLAGRRAFGADTCAEPAPVSGSPAVDRVAGPCLAKDPDARPARIQKVILELKLLTVAARRAEAAAALRRDKSECEAIRSEMHEMEARMDARLRTYERATADLQQSVGEALASLREQLSVLRAELASSQERLAAIAAPQPEEQFEAMSARILAHVNRAFQTVSESVGALERTVEGIQQHSHQFEQTVVNGLVEMENSMKANAAAVDGVRATMTQTDDLVERVVEALESLQNAVLDAVQPGAEKPSMVVN